jgi:glycosyltransferase involved in cell wall biosynthesis
MRAGMLLEALAGRFAVDVVIVPVSGGAVDDGWAAALARSITVVEPVDASSARRHTILQLADAALRERLAAAAPLSARVRLAPPTLANDAAGLLEPQACGALAVFVLRGYLAPFGCTLAGRLHARRIIVDLDDDDEALARSAGAHDEADAAARLARAWLGDADVVCAAAATEAREIAARYGLANVATLPNAVRQPPSRPPPPPGRAGLLFVGNLTYGPNLDAARLLADEILPIVLETHADATVELVGPHAGDLVGGPRVRVRGMVADLAPLYGAADVVVVPLRHGGGTRIKVLEAFAHQRPVVATPVAVAGLDVRDGHDVVLADSPHALAAAITALFDDPPRARKITARAVATLQRRYVQNVVAPLICDLVDGELGEREHDVAKEPN